VTRIGELGTTLAATSVVPVSPIFVTLIKEALNSYETSVLTRATRSNTQRTPFFIVTAMKTSNLKFQYFVCEYKADTAYICGSVNYAFKTFTALIASIRPKIRERFVVTIFSQLRFSVNKVQK
jgi:hypothetical protein